jgi:hypothetical protein
MLGFGFPLIDRGELVLKSKAFYGMVSDETLGFFCIASPDQAVFTVFGYFFRLDFE